MKSIVCVCVAKGQGWTKLSVYQKLYRRHEHPTGPSGLLFMGNGEYLIVIAATGAVGVHLWDGKGWEVTCICFRLARDASFYHATLWRLVGG